MDRPTYVQLPLWEHDGEFFTGPSPKGDWVEAVEVSVPESVASSWEEIASLAARRQREMAVYHDTALAAQAG